MKTLIALAVVLTLAACKTTPEAQETVIPKVVTQTVTRIVPVPEALTTPCVEHAPQEQTYAEAKRLALVRLESIRECNTRLERIRRLAQP